MMDSGFSSTDTSLELEEDRRALLARGFPHARLGMLRTSGGADIGYRVLGSGPSVMLIHGFPQSGSEWRYVAEDLALDHRVIVPDYRGAGVSGVDAVDYSKLSMAQDLHELATSLDAGRVHLVGHDIGMMVAFAYAAQFPEQVASVSMIDAVIPGTEHFRALIATGRSWHFGFHKQVELATALITGREDIYFDWIFDTFTRSPDGVPAVDRRHYVDLARRPGVLEAGIRAYAAFDQDGGDNAAMLSGSGRLTMPVQIIGGESSLGPYLDPLGPEIAENHRTLVVAGAGHFVPEEDPAAVVEALRTFLAPADQ